MIDVVQLGRFAIIFHKSLAYFAGPDFLVAVLRAQVVLADVQFHGVETLESMVEHQVFQSSVIYAAPMAPGQERIAHRDNAFFWPQVVEPRATDHGPVHCVHSQQCPARFHGPLKIVGEHRPLIAQGVGMLFPVMKGSLATAYNASKSDVSNGLSITKWFPSVGCRSNSITNEVVNDWMPQMWGELFGSCSRQSARRQNGIPIYPTCLLNRTIIRE